MLHVFVGMRSQGERRNTEMTSTVNRMLTKTWSMAPLTAKQRAY